jgi:predicted anti-sigma-YlaC factor YlaD
MNEVLCENPSCGKAIPEAVWKARTSRRPVTHHFCNRQCRAAYDRVTKRFKAMSEAGRDKRSQAVSQSNREKPRRKKKVS